MTIINILIGLIGLGIVVFVHEFGHLVAAKLVGIEVEAFSLGWGKRLAGLTWRGTEYRISVFPVGGYCKMKGERSYAMALDEDKSEIPHEPGSFFAVAPWKRIVALIAGPATNLLFAIIILSIVWLVGFKTETYSNRIILASDYTAEASAVEGSAPNPADEAGMQTGDVIVSINGEPVRGYIDIQQVVAQNALTELDLVVDRDGTSRALTLVPALDAETGSGFIGVYPWVDPVVQTVAEGSLATAAGVLPGDLISGINGTDVRHTIDLANALAGASFPLTISLVRDGLTHNLVLDEPQPGSDPGGQIVLGLAFRTVLIQSPDLNIFQALGRGAAESVETLITSVRSLRLLFRGVQITSAVAGPLRISYYIGDIATSGFALGFGTGLLGVTRFLALLSVILFFMNLLPIPILDGGQILLAAVEWIRGRGPRPKSVYRYQLVGSVIVMALLFVALFGDILFVAGR